ncbi:MAG TPA: AraC family transcriptional regulator [Pyrinomonadaceae bacterium]|jgi:AraC family transcriptional regulator
MSKPPPAQDRVLVQERFALHLRPRGRARWATEARQTYAALCLLDGALRWSGGDVATQDLAAPAALLAAPGEDLMATGARASVLLVTLSPAYVLDCAVRARLTRADARISFRTRAVNADTRLARLAAELADELRGAEAGQELVAAALVEQLTVHLLRRYAHVRRADELELWRGGLVDRRVRRAVELMHAQLAEDIPLEEMAAAAYLSPFHFARLFKKVTGTSPHAYLAALRLERAQALLATTDLSVTQVATRVGYTSPSHFAKAFRHATGLTPRAFRAAVVKG